MASNSLGGHGGHRPNKLQVSTPRSNCVTFYREQQTKLKFQLSMSSGVAFFKGLYIQNLLRHPVCTCRRRLWKIFSISSA